MTLPEMLPSDVDKKAVHRWVSGQRAAEQRSFQQMRTAGPMSSEDSFTAAMEVCSLTEASTPDSVRNKEVADARSLWATLKRKWAASHA